MKYVPLGEICDFIMGQAPPGEFCNFDSKGMPFVKAGEFSALHPEIKEWTTQPLKIGQAGDVFICVVGATSGKLNLGIDCAIGRSVAAIRPYTSILDQIYLYNFLKTWTDKLRSRSQGSAQGVITKPMLSELEIPLPPLDEQRHIAAILDKADAIRRKRVESIRLTEEFLRSTFLEMFGDPVMNPKGWDFIRLDEVCTKITDGEHLNPTFINAGFPVVMANNVRTEGVVFEGVKFVSELDFSKFTKKCKPERDDVLIVSRGATIGRCTVVDTDRPFCLMGSTILLKIDRTLVSSAFLNYLLQHHAYQAKLYQTSSASAQQAIYLSHIKELLLPLPPLAVQHKFSKIVSESKKVLAHSTESSIQVESLFNALTQRAFRGEL